ncbi:MAG: glycosyltransferase family 4 protein [Oscillibacter sp.]|jgi:1,2-diacylglycerol 3-alpha-glucosyltransferase|nr:glycosyltransferase family 4 protein [Oscillibacter sp.]
MKVLITTDWYAPTINGVVTSVLNLQRELAALGHDVRILTLSDSPRSYQEGNVTRIGAVSAGKIYPGARLRTAPARRLLQDLEDWSPDIIHTQCEFSTFLMARRISAATGAPIVHTYHTVYEDYTHYFSPSRRWGKKAVAAFSRWIIERTSAVIAPTAKVRALLEDYHVDRPIFVVPTGIDLRQYTGISDSVYLKALRNKLGIPENNFILLYVGRLAEEKNVDELLRRTAELHRDDVTLLLVGDGPYRRQLMQQVQELGLTQQVIFAGMVPPSQVADYYRLGDLFVSASNSETQGLTYIEALASGLPALCRQDPCLTGVIRNGMNGWQFHTSEDFQEDLERFLGNQDLREQMSRAAAENARSFSAEVFSAHVAQVYAHVLGQIDRLYPAA